MNKIVFIRFKSSNVGGAENYLKRISSKLENSIVFSSGIYSANDIHVRIPKFLPNFIKFIYFSIKYNGYYKNNRQYIYFSLDRVINCDIYRAGDGIHKEWLNIKNDNLVKKIKSIFNPMNLIYLYIEKKLFNNAKKIIANSNMIKNSIINYYNIDESKIEVIYNGINIPDNIDKQSKKEIVCNMLEIKPKTKIILFVGSGYKRKGLKKALEILSNINSEFHFIVIGKEKKLQYYKQLAYNLGIYNKISFLQSRNDVNLFYEASDIFLFPTIYEPCSNATLEAASYKNAILTTKTNGASEIFDSNCVLDDNIENNVMHIKRLLEDETLLSEIQNNCHKAASILDIESHINKTLEIINSI